MCVCVCACACVCARICTSVALYIIVSCTNFKYHTSLYLWFCIILRVSLVVQLEDIIHKIIICKKYCRFESNMKWLICLRNIYMYVSVLIRQFSWYIVGVLIYST